MRATAEAAEQLREIVKEDEADVEDQALELWTADAARDVAVPTAANDLVRSAVVHSVDFARFGPIIPRSTCRKRPNPSLYHAPKAYRYCDPGSPVPPIAAPGPSSTVFRSIQSGTAPAGGPPHPYATYTLLRCRAHDGSTRTDPV